MPFCTSDLAELGCVSPDAARGLQCSGPGAVENMTYMLSGARTSWRTWPAPCRTSSSSTPFAIPRYLAI
jgi:hypothetical protein